MTNHHLDRVRVVILGGGIHGVGVLHDLASRGWRDLHLLEKESLGYGTSSRSTKLIHGGLRYLKRISQFSMVQDCLKERELLHKLAPDLVHPLQFVIPLGQKTQPNSFVMRSGLYLYDFLAHSKSFPHHKSLNANEAHQLTPCLATEKFSHFFNYWDAQTDDHALVVRVASSAKKLGAMITEGALVTNVAPNENGWRVTYRDDTSEKTIDCLYVVNCLGPWANSLLEKSQLTPQFEGINNKGSHLFFPDIGLKAGLLLFAPEDRIFFILPWNGFTLLGTTEEFYNGDPDSLTVSEEEIDYLLKTSAQYLKTPFHRKDILGTFSGLRWLAKESGQTISSTSREAVITKHENEKGFLLTLYGGKLTSYRLLSEKIGGCIVKDFGVDTPSQTENPEFWETPATIKSTRKNAIEALRTLHHPARKD